MSRFPFFIFVALRFMMAKKDNHSISFFSIVSFLGLMIGVAALIIVLSVMNGFEKEMHKRILGMVPHVSMSNTEGSSLLNLASWEIYGEEKKLEQSDDVLAYAPFIQMDGMFVQDGVVSGVRVVGILPEEEGKVSIVPNFIIAGELDALQTGSHNIVVGSGIARKMGLRIGSDLTFVLPEATQGGAGVYPRFHRFTIVGFFSVGADADSLLAYVHIDDAALIKHASTQIDGLRFAIKDVYEAAEVLEKFEKAEVESGEGLYEFSSWTKQYGQLFQTVKLEKVMTGFMLMLIVLVASFNIIASMLMLVAEKHVGIAVLRTMGMTSYSAVNIFLFQGFVIGVLGVLLGVGLGLLLSFNLAGFIDAINASGLLWVAPMGAEVRAFDVVVVSVMAFLLCLLATVLPAMHASLIEPADAIKYH